MSKHLVTTTTNATIIAPVIHLNGTSRSELVAQFEQAYSAVGAALDAAQKAAPNARDFYVQSDDAFKQANAEHLARLRALTALKAEFFALYQAVEG